MEKEQLIAAGEAAFGKRWQTELSEALGVSVRTVRYWVVGKNKIPAKLSADIVLILKHRQKKISEAITMATEKFLMNPETGSVDTEENWLSEMSAWDENPDECRRQFRSLVEVVKDQSGEWRPV